MRLAQFIVANVARIVDEWEAFAATLEPAAKGLSSAELRDHAGAILLAAARDMQSEQTVRERRAKARGTHLNKTPSLDDAATCHGELRHYVGFDLVQMTAEFRHLRATVIRLWVASLTAPGFDSLQDMIRFNEAIDEALAESTAAYAEQVNHSRDIFLAILGHDLRGPLQAVSLSTELLSRKAGLNADGLRYVSRIKSSALHMESMVSDLLTFVRSRLGNQLPIVKAPMDMATACQAAIEEARAAHPDCQADLVVSGDTSGAWDKGRIRQLLQNLIGNALQHGDQHRPITLTLEGASDHVLLRMHNFGTPIPAELMNSLFDPMVRGPADEVGETSLGLGLFIVSEVVNGHGGTVQVSSSATTGTCFTVMLTKGR